MNPAPYPLVDFPDAASNEAALPQLAEVLNRLLSLPVTLRIAAGPDTARLGGLAAVLQRQHPTQVILGPEGGRAALAVFPGATSMASALLPGQFRDGVPAMTHAALDARQILENFRAETGQTPHIQWFYRTDGEALWDALWAAVRELRLV
jgi:hypothetical protein